MADLDLATLDQHKTGGFPDDYPPDRRTFYSPVDDVHAALLTVVASASRSLSIAMYGYDDDELHKVVLEKLTHPEITVQISLDSSQAGGKHEAALIAAWLDPATATPRSSIVSVGRSEKGAIQHMKAVVVDGLYTVTGSTNWSDGGETKQDNQLTIIGVDQVALDLIDGTLLYHLHPILDHLAIQNNCISLGHCHRKRLAQLGQLLLASISQSACQQSRLNGLQRWSRQETTMVVGVQQGTQIHLTVQHRTMFGDESRGREFAQLGGRDAFDC